MVRLLLTVALVVGCSSPAETRDPPRSSTGPLLPPPQESAGRLAHPRLAGAALATVRAPSAFEDLDRDGHADLVVGRTEGPPPNELADVHLVTADGIDVRPSEVIGASTSCGLGELPLVRLGDLDGDGLGELGVARAAGYDASVTIVHGHAQGAEERTSRIGSPVQGALSCFGQSIVSVDLDGDGHLDLIVGAPMTDAERGSVFVYRSTDGAIPSDPTATIAGTVPGARFGTAIGVCDLVGDGSPDLIVGATEEGELRGAVYVIEGDAGGFASTGVRLASPSDPRNHRFGARIAAASDASGHCVVLVGGVYGVREIVRGPSGPSLSSFHVEGERAPFALGDVTGDGGIEAIVCDGSSLRVHRRGDAGLASEPIASLPTPVGDGCADLAVPGDLNADGRADVIVGIRGYQSRPSRALVYYGVSGGLDPHPLTLGALSGGGSMGFASWVR